MTISIFLSILLLAKDLYHDTNTFRSSRGTLFVSHESMNQQVMLEHGGKIQPITNFKRGEGIRQILLSENDSLLLIWHIPRGRKALRLSVMELHTSTIRHTVIPGFGGDLYWTKTNNILLTRGREFLLYDSNLKEITDQGTDCSFENVQEDVIFDWPCTVWGDRTLRVWSLSSGKLILEQDFRKEYGENCSIRDVQLSKPGVFEVSIDLSNVSGQDTTVTEILSY